MAINVAVVDDTKDIRENLKRIIDASDDLVFVKDFANGDSFLTSLKHLQADVVIMDIEMPGKNGVQCIQEAKVQRPEMLFLVFTAFDDDDYLFDAMCAGASSYLLKNAAENFIIKAIKDVMDPEGSVPMSPSIARKTLKLFQSHGNSKKSASDNYGLTDKEIVVLKYLELNLQYKQIADKMNISLSTVESHIKKIYPKLGVTSRGEAVKKYFSRKFFSK